MKTSKDYRDNLLKAKKLIKEVSDADIIVLPEAFLIPFGSDTDLNSEEIMELLEELAKEADNILVAGTVPEKTSEGTYNTSFIFNNKGKELLGKYRKVHLFDVGIPGVDMTESDRYLSGEEPGVIDTPYGKLGVAVCFDLRFPEQFIHYAKEGAKLIVVPAAFSIKTGPIHFKVLNQARALDSQCFIAGCTPAQNDTLDFPVYGGSIIVDPYGKVREEANEDEQILIYDLDIDYADVVRKELPILETRKSELFN